MRTVNKVTLIGVVGAEPEIRTTASGTKLAKVSLATDSGPKDKRKTQWHRLTMWDKLADLAEQYVQKGDRIYIEGRLEYSQTEDASGQPRYWTDVIVGEVVLLGGGEKQSAPKPTKSPFDPDDDDLPI